METSIGYYCWWIFQQAMFDYSVYIYIYRVRNGFLSGEDTNIILYEIVQWLYDISAIYLCIFKTYRFLFNPLTTHKKTNKITTLNCDEAFVESFNWILLDIESR